MLGSPAIFAGGLDFVYIFCIVKARMVGYTDSKSVGLPKLRQRVVIERLKVRWARIKTLVLVVN